MGCERGMIDCVYPVRRGSYNEELRFSIRSLEANLPHGRIILAGAKPKWVRESESLIFVPTTQHMSKWRNSINNVIAAMKAIEDISRPFLLLNDDFYILRPIEEMPTYHMGYMADVIERYRRQHHTGAYWRGMVETYELLRANGFEKPLSYGLHLPLPIYPGPYYQALELGRNITALHMRSLYGNLAGLGGEEREDVKIHHKRRDEWPRDYLSSNDDLHITGAGKLLHDLFPTPSRHEL